MILPLLICRTAPGFNLPFLTTGVLAFSRYEVDEKTGAESRRIGRCCRWNALNIEKPRPRPRVWGRRRRRVAIVRDVVVVPGVLCWVFEKERLCSGGQVMCLRLGRELLMSNDRFPQPIN